MKFYTIKSKVKNTDFLFTFKFSQLAMPVEKEIFVLANINFSLDLKCCIWKYGISRPGDFRNLAGKSLLIENFGETELNV